jgi:hypothetical protein
VSRFVFVDPYETDALFPFVANASTPRVLAFADVIEVGAIVIRV